MEESPQLKQNRLDELFHHHQKVYTGMIFSSTHGTVPTSIRNTLLRMGWQEFSREQGHTRDQINLTFAKRPKVKDLSLLFENQNFTSKYGYSESKSILDIKKINHFPNAGFLCIKD